jgi:hypothetical protein
MFILSWFQGEKLENKIGKIVKESVEKSLGSKSGWGGVQGSGWLGSGVSKNKTRVIRKTFRSR